MLWQTSPPYLPQGEGVKVKEAEPDMDGYKKTSFGLCVCGVRA